MSEFKSYCLLRETLAPSYDEKEIRRRFMTEMMQRIIAAHPEEAFKFIQKIAAKDQELAAAVGEFNKASQNSLRTTSIEDSEVPNPKIN